MRRKKAKVTEFTGKAYDGRLYMRMHSDFVSVAKPISDYHTDLDAVYEYFEPRREDGGVSVKVGEKGTEYIYYDIIGNDGGDALIELSHKYDFRTFVILACSIEARRYTYLYALLPEAWKEIRENCHYIPRVFVKWYVKKGA